MLRPEHPTPQFERADWLNLNGEWELEIDPAKGADPAKPFSKKINVPFCPESRLSGVGYTDFMNTLYYRRSFTRPESFAGRRVLLHFGAVDYKASVFINGEKAGEHTGGYTPFCFDITDLCKAENELLVRAEDEHTGTAIPTGKQSHKKESYGCFYTRTTGIWQTVWLEAVDAAHIEDARYFTDPQKSEIEIAFTLSEAATGCLCRAEASYEGAPMGNAEAAVCSPALRLTIPLTETHLWEPGHGRLYDLKLTLIKDGAVIDSVKSYFGLRSVDLSGYAMRINQKPVFGRFVLDQGFYPDGVYTAPDEAALRADIEAGLALGFNGARMHEKVFEPRYLYYADKLGYMVWGEYPNWGYLADMKSAEPVLAEWREAVARDFNHPGLIGWCPFNETWDNVDPGQPGEKEQDKEVLRAAYRWTKKEDPTRPVIDVSGNFHCGETDIFDVHDYCQDPAAFAGYYDKIREGVLLDQIERSPSFSKQQTYTGGPVFVSEYGGIRWSEDKDGWGYGNAPKSEAEFFERYRRLTDLLLDNDAVMGFCYTQLYDVEQEQNGLMTYERKFKFAPERIRVINERKAKIEE